MPTYTTQIQNGCIPQSICSDARDWRCRCQNLLGKRRGDRLEVRFARGHQYTMNLPVSAVCRNCGRLNELQPALRRG